MTQEELQKFINGLEHDVAKDEASFGIFQYGSGPDENTFIRANEDGLKLFVIELLKAVTTSQSSLSATGKKIIPIASDELWISQASDVFIEYIEPISRETLIEKPVEYKETFIDKLVPFGCIAIVVILVAALLIGLWTIGKWIF